MAGAGLIRRVDALEAQTPDIGRDWSMVLDRLAYGELERLESIVARMLDGEPVESMDEADRVLVRKVEEMEV